MGFLSVQTCVFLCDSCGFFLVWLFCHILIHLVFTQMPICFLIRDRNGMDPDGRVGGEKLG